jgi:hypothetical protein
MRVTFDTNVFDKVTRPSTYPNDPHRQEMIIIHEALKQGRLQGFISDTVITLEGIGTDDRAIVFGSTGPRSSMAQTSDDIFTITMRTEQPDRKPFHSKQAERVVAAVQLGIRLLGAPRAGMPQVTEKQFYTTEDPAVVGERLDRFVSTLRQIESRGLGSARAKRIAARLASPGAFPGPWFKALGEAKDIHEKREVARAVAEWADAR